MPKFVVYRVTPGPRSYGFGQRQEFELWREVNDARKKIADAATTSKDSSFPVVYDMAGNFIVEGWAKGPA